MKIMKKRKIPMRKDIVTGEMMPKRQLIRVVKNKENEVSLDPTGKKPGRGAYVAVLLKKLFTFNLMNHFMMN